MPSKLSRTYQGNGKTKHRNGYLNHCRIWFHLNSTLQYYKNVLAVSHVCRHACVEIHCEDVYE